MGTDGKRVELIDEGDASNSTSYIGLGLLASLVIGFSPLLDAIQGNGPFENAMIRFLACLAVSVIAAATLGRLLDSAPSRAQRPSTPNGDHGESESPLISEDPTDGK